MAAVPLVENTLPFDGAVYITEGGPGDVSIRQTWPTQSTTTRSGFAGIAGELFVFRPTDGALYYMQAQHGLFVDDSPTAADSLVPTPPCVVDSSSGLLLTSLLGYTFGFDGQGRLVYQCDDQVFRGDGTAVPGPGNLVGALADGRVLMVEPDGTPTGARLTVVAPAGDRGPSLSLPGYAPFLTATTVRDNDAFVLLFRPDDQTGTSNSFAGELVEYRINPQSEWLHVRTLHIDSYGLSQVALSDGTIVILLVGGLNDTNGTAVAFLPDGTQQTIWGEGTTAKVGQGSSLLFIGPRE
jgi:hypothetical protein